MLHLRLQPLTETRLKKVLALYGDDECFAQQMIAYQMGELQKALLSLRLDLRAFEKQYRLSTMQFYSRFQAGELDDNEDFMLWAGAYELLLDNEARLAELNQ